MHADELRKGMKVKISGDISKTTRILTSNPDMQNMAGNGKIYEIDAITPHLRSNEPINVARILSYVWMAEDLIISDGTLEDGENVIITGDKVLFDPNEL